ncbi:MAG: methionyl-tRNA formyltransferase [Myxococcales bacterium]|nr:methionyl-tRNA formyltransferase [Myxococcales bacterium]
MSRLRAAFMGSPAFAVPSLHAVHRRCDLQLVVCQPDRPAGRGRKLTPPAVKLAALELSLPVEQPRKMKDGRLAAQLRTLDLDVVVVVAFGRILPPDVLAVPRHGCINVHASRLPRWRGAAPIQRAVLAGDRSTAVALMQMDEGLDTGPVYRMVDTPIGELETSGELFERLAGLGAEALDDLLAVFPDVPPPRPQPAEGITHAAMLAKPEGRVDWERGVRALVDHVRGMDPWPLAAAEYEGQPLKLFSARPSPHPRGEHAPGTVVAVDADGLHVAALDGVVQIGEVQPPGKRRMTASDWASGRRLAPGARLR